MFPNKIQETAVPNLEFRFKASDLNFHLDSYDWLFVAGGDYTRYRDTGAVNSQGEHKFLIWAGDGTGSNGEDTFRIKIWREDEFGIETVIYDNGMDQAISGGRIVVHSGK